MTDEGHLDKILASPAYRKAYEDIDFFQRDDLRAVYRLMAPRQSLFPVAAFACRAGA